jgi:hypothetical protein
MVGLSHTFSDKGIKIIGTSDPLSIDLSPNEWNFDLDKPGQKFHHSLKEHHKISNIPKFRCEML